MLLDLAGIDKQRRIAIQYSVRGAREFDRTVEALNCNMLEYISAGSNSAPLSGLTKEVVSLVLANGKVSGKLRRPYRRSAGRIAQGDRIRAHLTYQDEQQE